MAHAPDLHSATHFFLRNPAAIFSPDAPFRVIRKCRHYLDRMPLGYEMLTQSGGEGRDGSTLRRIVNSKDQNSHRSAQTARELWPDPSRSGSDNANSFLCKRPALSSSCRIHAYVTARPSSSEILGSHPSTRRSWLLSLLRPRTPCGLLVSCCLINFLPASPQTRSNRLLIVISRSVPRFSGSWKSEAMRRSRPSTQSSTYMNDRVCSPSPQTSIVPISSVSATFLQTAAGAFSRPPS